MRRLGLSAAAPLVLLAERNAGLRIVSLTAAAEAAGLRRGQAAADARAILPDLFAEAWRPELDAAALNALARWAGRFSPWVGRDPAPEGAGALALDVTGCAHLFGGEAALLESMTGRLDALGFTARAAVADAKGAAWALARYGPPCAIAPVGRARAALADLPPAALRLDTETAETLARLGVATIGALAGLPRAAVARRFGETALRRLDQAFGAEPEPVAPAAPLKRHAVRLSLPEPIGAVADMAAGLDRLLARLCAHLEADGVGARRLRLEARRVDRSAVAVEIRLARPSRAPERIRPLFDRGVEGLDARFGVDALRLEALEVEPLSPRQTHAGPDGRDPRAFRDGEALDALLSRLGARLGFERIFKLAPVDAHPPEKAFRAVSLLERSHGAGGAAWASAEQARAAAPTEQAVRWADEAARRPPRPLIRLSPEILTPVAVERGDAAVFMRPPVVLDLSASSPSEPADRPPAAFRWRGRLERVAALAGPERIAPEWWLDDPAWRTGVRDYWRVETIAGARLWIYVTPQATQGPEWRVAGVFA